MFYLITDCNYPHINLATEEYILKNRTEQVFMVYRNNPCIVSGRNQNIMAEINCGHVFNNNIPLIRRISGGGTVYHDTGNLNYAFIENGRTVDLSKHRQFICESLNKIGFNAVPGPGSNITLYGKKISGNAATVSGNRTMHHGTLLYDTNLNELNKTLSESGESYNDKAVDSKRSLVVNLSEYDVACNKYDIACNKYDIACNKPDIDGFTGRFISAMKSVTVFEGELSLRDEELQAINKLASEKYITPEWIIGQSPVYNLHRTVNAGGCTYVSDISVEKGRIIKCSIYCLTEPVVTALSVTVPSIDSINYELFTLCNILKGVWHHPRLIYEILVKTPEGLFFLNQFNNKWISVLF